MKGFKKDGKFRPTEKKSKSSLKKSDLKKQVRKKEDLSKGFYKPYTKEDLKRIGKEWDSASTDERKKIIINTHNGFTDGHNKSIVTKFDDLPHHIQSTIAGHYDVAHEPFDEDRANFFKVSRGKVSLSEGLHRPEREDGKFTPLTPEQKEENIDAIVDNTHPIYIQMVRQFPNSSVGSDVHRWAEGGDFGSHGHFGDKLRDGDIEGAMYRADGDNLEHLGDLHIENLLSDRSNHPLDPSPRKEFLSRLEWARGRTQKQRENPLAD